MDFIKVRVKFQEPFKDGNILEGRSFNGGQIVEISETDADKIRQSGGVFDVLDKLIPNPRKQEVVEEKPVEALPERKAGDSKKNATKAKN